jgi:hypothetical protein
VTLVTQALKTAQKLFLKMGISKNGGNWHLEAFLWLEITKYLNKNEIQTGKIT